MKTRVTFPIIGIIVGLLASLWIPMSISAEEVSMRSMTKDIPLMHIDGGEKLTLDVSDDLGLTAGQASKLVNALPAQETDGAGVTIEVLKPVDAIGHSKALVIRQIKLKSTRLLVDGGTAGIKIREIELQGMRDPVSLEDWKLEFNLLREDKTKRELALPEDGNEFTFIELIPTVLIELYNTTKSRLDLQNWQIRFTYGAMPDAADTTMHKVIDRMSNWDDRDWKHRDLPGLGLLIGNVSMSRHIDVERLNDPTKTREEQLSAISDGTRLTGWDVTAVPSNLNDWIELYNLNDNLNDKGWQMKIKKHSKDENGNPRILHVPSPPTDNR